MQTNEVFSGIFRTDSATKLGKNLSRANHHHTRAGGARIKLIAIKLGQIRNLLVIQFRLVEHEFNIDCWISGLRPPRSKYRTGTIYGVGVEPLENKTPREVGLPPLHRGMFDLSL